MRAPLANHGLGAEMVRLNDPRPGERTNMKSLETEHATNPKAN